MNEEIMETLEVTEEVSEAVVKNSNKNGLIGFAVGVGTTLGIIKVKNFICKRIKNKKVDEYLTADESEVEYVDENDDDVK